MARPGLTIHPKFRKLVYLLGEPEPHCLGYLEYLWMVSYENGEPIIGDELVVELSSRYPGERGKLCKALLESGFIDAISDGRFAIHDLYDHAPAYVQNRARKENERRKDKVCLNCGASFHSTETHARYCHPACRTAAYRSRGVTECDEGVRHCDERVTRCDAHVTECDEPPAPAPAPAPINTPPPPSGGEACANGQHPTKPTRKRPPRSSHDADAIRVVDHYQQTVKPDHGKDGAASNVAALLASALTVEVLCRAADGYAAGCREKGTEAKYRMKARNFYGRAGGYKDYLDYQKPKPADYSDVLKARAEANPTGERSHEP